MASKNVLSSLQFSKKWKKGTKQPIFALFRPRRHRRHPAPPLGHTKSSAFEFRNFWYTLAAGKKRTTKVIYEKLVF